MKRSSILLVVGDLILLAFLSLMLDDWQGRDIKAVANGCDPSASLSVQTRMFGMSGRRPTLQSVPALDRVKVLVVLLAFVNAIFPLVLEEEKTDSKIRRGAGRLRGH